MGNPDKKYLGMQFRLKVHQKSATEFQTFFEDIMQAAFPDFQKIQPYGKRGDEGNDGYRPDKGIYYQVYAPKNPEEKHAEAGRKLKRDFEKLKKTWNRIAEVKVFYFVFNDKYGGSSIEIEEALDALRISNPSIEFKPFLAKHLEAIFFTLDNDAILSLGFDIDSTNALRICKETLGKMEAYLDRGNGTFVFESLQSIRDIIAGQNDEHLSADWEIMQCRALQQLERVKEARQKYGNLYKRYPNDPRPALYLSEIYLRVEEYEKNEELLREAERIDKNNSLLQIEKLLRDIQLGKKIDAASITEANFPTDARAKSNFYRLYTVVLAHQEDFSRADSFIERAISLNPDRLSNYIAKLSISEHRLALISLDDEKAKVFAAQLLTEVDDMLAEASQWGQLSPRNQAIFNLAKFKASAVLENLPELERLAKDICELLLQCYFDLMVDQLLTELLYYVEMPQEDLDRLLAYLRSAEKGISDHLAKVLVVQFALKKTLLTEGRGFFIDMKKENILRFIADLEGKKYEEAWHFMEGNAKFAVAFVNAAKDFPDLRKEIIGRLPDDTNIQKEKLLLLLNYDESRIDEAFDILRKLDFSKLRYLECRMILQVARRKKAWEFVILVIEKLLSYEQDKEIALQLELQLFDVNLKLDRLPEVIKIGEGILSDGDKMARLDPPNRENLLAQTILARLTRGEYPRAMALIETYPDIPRTFEFKAGVEADVYLWNNQPRKAIAAIVDGIKILKTPTQEQYAKLFVPLGKIENMVKLSLDSLLAFEPETFVKFKDEERWYFVGDGGELDALKICSADERYAGFLDKKIGDKVTFVFKYRPSSEHIIEKILPIDKYIFTQSVRHFNQLAAEGNLEAVWVVQVPQKGETIDTKNIETMMEDMRRGRGDFFDSYCRENIPLAFLSVVEGGLTYAIGLIQNEGRGFVRFSSGEYAEMDRQKEVARRIIAGDMFYLDGTSALILSETGLLDEISPYLPNMKVSQSVITLLLRCKERFAYVPGQVGHMHYAHGQLRFSSIDPAQREHIRTNFDSSVKLLESKPADIGVISAASKTDNFIEQKIPAELCDACVLAQEGEMPVLTEDYLYLQANGSMTGKKVPEYCSTFALIRVLYEQGKITFEKYLGFFAYLSGYRFRFLPFTVDDIEKAVFGEGIITVLRPERIRWFNFPLTLSKAYGVPFASALRVVSTFMVRILTQDAILPDITERIFLEILSGFPTDKDKRSLGKFLLALCAREIEKMHKTLIIGPAAKDKLARLFNLMDIYKAGDNLWRPPE